MVLREDQLAAASNSSVDVPPLVGSLDLSKDYEWRTLCNKVRQLDRREFVFTPKGGEEAKRRLVIDNTPTDSRFHRVHVERVGDQEEMSF